MTDKKQDATRCCANCKWLRTVADRYYCGWDVKLSEVDPTSTYCIAFGTGREADDDSSQWEQRP